MFSHRSYLVVVVDVMNPVIRCLYRGGAEEFVSVEGESGFLSLPREVDSHFIERGHHLEVAVIVHS